LSVTNNAEAEAKARATVADLQSPGVPAFCDRYHIAEGFLDAVTIPT
jgi:hypothetical protein